MARVATVTHGSEVYDGCPETSCRSERTWCEVLALTDVGPVVLGRLVQCSGCGNSFACAYCPDSVEFDGMAIFRHVLDNHGEYARA